MVLDIRKQFKHPGSFEIRMAAMRFWEYLSGIGSRLETRVAWFVAGACVIIFLARLIFINQHGGFPSGSDPGNWLAFSKDLFGSEAKAAASTYPPVVPFVVWLLNLFLPPMVSVNILGLIISIAIGLVFYVIARNSISIWWAAVFSVAAMFLGYSMEMWAWGGYPQLLAQTLVVLSLYSADQWLQARRPRFFWIAVASSALAVGTSSMAIPLLAIGLPVIYLTVTRQERLPVVTSLKRLVILAIFIIGSSAVFLPWYIETLRLAQGAIWNPGGYSLQNINQAFGYAFRDWSPLFSSVFVLLPLGVLTSAYLILVRRPKPLLRSIAAVLMVASLVLFAITWEIRTLAVFQIGLLAGVAVLLHDIYFKMRNVPRLHTARLLAVALVLVIPILIIARGNARFVNDFNWYQVVDKPVLQALDYLKSQEDGKIVVAQGNPRGNFYLWWIEGYSSHPAYTTSDPKWLNFTEEREQAAVARQLLASPVSDIGPLANKHDIRYVWLDKGVAGDIANLLSAGFFSTFENERIVILRMGLLLEQPAPEWWPSENSALENFRNVNPPGPAETLSAHEADYYRMWYIASKNNFGRVLGWGEDQNPWNILQDISTMPPRALWEEIADLKLAEKAGVMGDPRYPEYHFRLWEVSGKPPVWPPDPLDHDAAINITPPSPPPGVSTGFIKDWYKWNRSALATVYYGSEDSNPDIHVPWARQYDDLNLYTEIMNLQQAFNAGVMGSPDEPFRAFNVWKQKANMNSSGFNVKIATR